jgi:hypothetical protein
MKEGRDMGPALIGFAGVSLGIIGTLVVANLTARSAERLAERSRTEQRLQSVRQLAADAYVSAIEATAWLSAIHVEDSVDPQFAGSYGPKTARAVSSLRLAQKSMNKAAALGGSLPLVEIAIETARVLAVLDDAWHSGQEYRLKLVASRTEGKAFYKKIFMVEYERLIQSRKALTGFDDKLQPRDEVDKGGLMPGSLLHQLREAIAVS